MLKILVFVIIFALVIFAVKTTDNTPKQADVGNFSIIKEDKTLKAKWVGEAANDLKSQGDVIRNIQKQMQDMQLQNKELNERIKNTKQRKLFKTAKSPKKIVVYTRSFPSQAESKAQNLKNLFPRA